MPVTVTRWQIRVGSEWRTYDAGEVAQFACADKFARPDSIRLADVCVPDGIRFSRYPKSAGLRTRGVNARRLAAARRKFSNAREAAGLFSEVERGRQPTPEQYIEKCDIESDAREASIRASIAEAWRRARLAYRALNEEQKVCVREICSRGIYPGDATTLAHVCRRVASEKHRW